MGRAGTFCSGVGSPQCTVRVMSVVPSLQKGVMNGALGAPGCGAVVGGGSLFKATHRYCPPVSKRYISLADSVRLLPLEGL